MVSYYDGLDKVVFLATSDARFVRNGWTLK